MVEVLLGEFRDVGIHIVSESEGVDDPILIDIAFAHQTLRHHVGKEPMVLIAFQRLLR